MQLVRQQLEAVGEDPELAADTHRHLANLQELPRPDQHQVQAVHAMPSMMVQLPKRQGTGSAAKRCATAFRESIPSFRGRSEVGDFNNLRHRRDLRQNVLEKRLISRRKISGRALQAISFT
jgi:hypothetical protein